MSWTMLFLLDLISGLCCQQNVVPSGNNKTQIFHNKSEIGIIKDKCQTLKTPSKAEMFYLKIQLTDTLYKISCKRMENTV